MPHTHVLSKHSKHPYFPTGHTGTVHHIVVKGSARVQGVRVHRGGSALVSPILRVSYYRCGGESLMRFISTVLLEEKPLTHSSVTYTFMRVQSAWARNLRGIASSGLTFKRSYHLYLFAEHRVCNPTPRVVCLT